MKKLKTKQKSKFAEILLDRRFCFCRNDSVLFFSGSVSFDAEFRQIFVKSSPNSFCVSKLSGVENDIPEIVDALLKNPRTDVNWRIPKGPRESYTAFHTAIELPSRWKILWMLMKFHRVDVNAKTNMGVTPLMLICHVGNMLALRKLLADRRVELSIRDDSLKILTKRK